MQKPPETPRQMLEAAEAALRAGQVAEAAAQAIALDGVLGSTTFDDLDCASLHSRFGKLLVRLNRSSMAITQFQRAVEIHPDDADAWYSCGVVQKAEGQLPHACQSFQQAVTLDPQHVGATHNLGQTLFELGQIDSAVQQLMRAISLGGGTKSETLLAIIAPHAAGFDDQALLQLRSHWAQRCLKPLAAPPSTRRQLGGKLRVGYVSSYFHQANWMKPVWGLINEHSREEFEIYLYSDAPEAEITSGYRAHEQDRVFHTKSFTNEQLAQLIRSHELDLLIDLNSFSDARRLDVFMHKPAPKIAGWFNLYATSGMPSFDAIIGDAVVVRPEEEQYYSERVLRVDGCYLTFSVNYPVPEVATSPCQAGASFTFGSLCSIYKITPQVVGVWAAILRECPAARLLLKNSGFSSQQNRSYLGHMFMDLGVARERLIFERPAPHYEFLQAYDRIDLALDTFPYTGGTTTSEALWQGVPVLTVSGDRWLPRVSASILHYAGLDEFVAGDLDEYATKAVALGNDAAEQQRLAAMRLSVRSQLVASPLCDTRGFARQMEALYCELTLRNKSN